MLGDAPHFHGAAQRMISIRRQHPAFGHGKFAWFPVDSKAVIAYWRVLEDERLIILNNLTDQVQTVSIDPTIIQAPELYNLLIGIIFEL